jgi:multicomponent Na+:H+ antiporter subunit F
MFMHTILFVMINAALLLAFFRLARGPSLPDRIVALDLISSLVIGDIAVYAVATDQSVYLDIALVLALIAFLGTVAFAYYVERGGFPWRKS